MSDKRNQGKGLARGEKGKEKEEITAQEVDAVKELGGNSNRQFHLRYPAKPSPPQ